MLICSLTQTDACEVYYPYMPPAYIKQTTKVIGESVLQIQVNRRTSSLPGFHCGPRRVLDAPVWSQRGTDRDFGKPWNRSAAGR